MTIAQSEPAPLLAVGAMLGEGPAWDEWEQELLFVDIISERVHRFRPGTGEHSWSKLIRRYWCFLGRHPTMLKPRQS